MADRTLHSVAPELQDFECWFIEARKLDTFTVAKIATQHTSARKKVNAFFVATR
jgi:hypothetical protein